METATTIKKGYKQTELGVIPEDWEVRTLGEISEIKTGKKNNNDKEEEGRYPFFVRSQHVERINTYSFNGEAILIPGEGNIGDIYHYINGKFDWHQRVYKISNFSEEYSGKFIYLSMSQNFNAHAMKNSVKATVDSLRLPTFQEFEISFPPTKNEQIAIATVLSDADALIENLEKLIVKKKAIKQGTMQQLLTGKKRLPGFKNEFERTILGRVATFEHGYGLSKADLNDDGKYKCIHYGQLFTEYKELIGETKSKTDVNINNFYSKENDVLMPTSDVTPKGLATASCIRETGVVLGGGILVIRLANGYDGLYLSYFITQNKNTVLKFVKGSTVFHLYAGEVSNLEVVFPGFEEQKAIAQIISDMDSEIEKLESQLAKYQDIKQGMMQQLLTGKIRIYANK